MRGEESLGDSTGVPKTKNGQSWPKSWIVSLITPKRIEPITCGWSHLKIFYRFWSILAIFGPLGPPWRPPRTPHPSFLKSTIISYKISSNETDQRLLAQSVWEILRNQFKILVNFDHFWSFGAPVEAPVEAPMEPSPLVLEVNHNFL